jgi:hypothetical protein
MAEQGSAPSADAGTATASADAQTAAGQQAQQTQQTQQGGDEKPIADLLKGVFREIVEMKKELRTERKGQAPATKAEGKPAVSDELSTLRTEVETLRREREIDRAFVGRAIPESVRDLVARAVLATNPQDVGAAVKAELERLGPLLTPPTQATSPAAPQVKPPIAPSNTGAPVRGDAQGAPLSIKEMSADDISRMTPAEIFKAVTALEQGARGANPFRGIKRSHDR